MTGVDRPACFALLTQHGRHDLEVSWRSVEAPTAHAARKMQTGGTDGKDDDWDGEKEKRRHKEVASQKAGRQKG